MRTLARALAATGLVVVIGIAALSVIGSRTADAPPLTQPTAAPRLYVDDPALDALIATLVKDDAAALQARFGGVTAREGAVLGGPIGLYQPADVPAAEWTARLGSSQRAVHAVVRDPHEPFEWWDQPSISVARAAISSAPRDFDIVLIVGPTEGTRRPWRFSVAGGRVIDVVIDTGRDPGGSVRPLVRALGYLTPSPDSEPGRFLVLPPHEMRPAPAGIGFARGGPVPPAPVRSPSLAPDGRTGDPAIDAIIDLLVKGDAATLARTYPDLAARQERCDPSCDGVRISPAAWTSRLAGASRSLYAVFTGDPADVEVVLAVQGAGGASEAWQFGFVRGALAQVDIFLPVPQSTPTGGRIPVLQIARGVPSPAREIERFYVLPPKEDLPQEPRTHPLTTRTGTTTVDALLKTLAARDADRLRAAFIDSAAPFVRECRGAASTKDAAYAASWARDTSAQVHGLYAVTDLPAGYEPRADHLVIAYVRPKPYWWEAMGILERGGRIAGLITSEWGCDPQAIYPPSEYVVPPPANGLAGIDQARRSGIALIDRILDASLARNETALGSLIAYEQVACGDPTGSPPGAGPPACPSGVAPGTLIDILPVVVCHGWQATRDRAPQAIIEMIPREGPGLYAVVGTPPSRSVVIASATGGAVALKVNDRGITQLSAGCGPWHPDALIGGGRPSFLLSPP